MFVKKVTVYYYYSPQAHGILSLHLRYTTIAPKIKSTPIAGGKIFRNKCFGEPVEKKK